MRSIDCSQQGERSCDLSYRVNADGNLDPEGDGECTIDGCAEGSCPDEAVCVRIFGVQFLSVSCDPELEDQRAQDVTEAELVGACCEALDGACENATIRACVCGAEPDPDDPVYQQCCADGVIWSDACAHLALANEECDEITKVCPRDDCLPTERCLDEGLCANANTTRTSCRKACSDDADCREGYQCRQTGANGIYAVPSVDDPTERRQESICVPIGFLSFRSGCTAGRPDRAPVHDPPGCVLDLVD
ncbi:MAG: hypothetical protein KC468_09115, partial [Myxococcales bacterium]|nr:hypothetical protein [Myxococcales bacterium]